MGKIYRHSFVSDWFWPFSFFEEDKSGRDCSIKMLMLSARFNIFTPGRVEKFLPALSSTLRSLLLFFHFCPGLNVSII